MAQSSLFNEPITLSHLAARITDAIEMADGLTDVDVVAETSDVRETGGHCYMELVEKSPDDGKPLAKIRAVMWKWDYSRIKAKFMGATGGNIASDIKVRVTASVKFHPVFGLQLRITDIDPSYTLGDLQQRRNEIIRRLTTEGVIDMNRQLAWTDVPQRIAVISAQGAAGYGDFVNQLFSNPSQLWFSVELFPAVMQGASTPSSVVSALDRIAAQVDNFDCVVLIRGGGSTSELASFDDYNLAANIAQFPLPVIVGIGHERDVTVLDFVANMRVKTPTAAAEWLISRGEAALGRLRDITNTLLHGAVDCISENSRRLALIEGQLPTLVSAYLTRSADRLDSYAQLVATLSPQATLRRGYTITRTTDGKTVKDPSELAPGTEIVTAFASGTIHSITTDL